jgi:hypothetical protein
MSALHCRCDDPLVNRYGPGQVCWHCWQAAHGGDGTIPEPEIEEFELVKRNGTGPHRDPARAASRRDLDGMSRATRELIDALERALGPAVCTPVWVMASDYRESRRLERAKYRTFAWRCPSCGGGEEDPLQLYRPFVVGSDGRVWCEARGCFEDWLEATLRELVGGTR